ncbi:MAG: trypsin-like peptidase domain-containing protein [Bacteriovoracaceae bacterium]|nr:trypsin-like peptidase domain-containing protein [Bacteriovoracaceae bacterium]
MKNYYRNLFLIFLTLGCSTEKGSDVTTLKLQQEEILSSYHSVDYCQSKELRLQKAIYGKDGRMDPCQFSSKNEVMKTAQNVAMIVNANQIEKIGTTTHSELFRINAKTYAEFFRSRMGKPLCENVPYRNDPVPSFCTAFKIKTDNNEETTLLTAGHCLKGKNIKDLRIVFSISPENSGYTKSAKTTPNEIIVSKNQILKLDSVTTDESLNRLDVAAIKTDRNWESEGFNLDKEGTLIRENENLMLIGHPLGLEMKIDLGGEVKTVNMSSSNKRFYFEANVDAFHGNSGSPMISIDTGDVIGILVSGNGDFKMDWANNCYSERSYSDDFEVQFEKGLRIDSILDHINI